MSEIWNIVVDNFPSIPLLLNLFPFCVIFLTAFDVLGVGVDLEEK